MSLKKVKEIFFIEIISKNYLFFSLAKMCTKQNQTQIESLFGFQEKHYSLVRKKNFFKNYDFH